MSLAATMAQAVSTAQTALAQMQGMASGGTNVMLAASQTKCVGVFGIPVTQNIPSPGGGYRRRSFLPLTITRDQLSAPPSEKTKLVRTDLTPQLVYTIERVVADRALDWELHLVRSGEEPK